MAVRTRIKIRGRRTWRVAAARTAARAAGAAGLVLALAGGPFALARLGHLAWQTWQAHPDTPTGAPLMAAGIKSHQDSCALSAERPW